LSKAPFDLLVIGAGPGGYVSADREYYLHHQRPITLRDGGPDLWQRPTCVVRSCRRSPVVGGGELTPRSTGEASALPHTCSPFFGRYWHSSCFTMGHEKRLTLFKSPPSA